MVVLTLDRRSIWLGIKSHTACGTKAQETRGTHKREFQLGNGGAEPGVMSQERGAAASAEAGAEDLQNVPGRW